MAIAAASPPPTTSAAPMAMTGRSSLLRRASRRTEAKGTEAGCPCGGGVCGPLKGEVLGPEVCSGRAPAAGAENATPGAGGVLWETATAAMACAVDGRAGGALAGARCGPLMDGRAGGVAVVALAGRGRCGVNLGSGAGGGVSRALVCAGKSVG